MSADLLHVLSLAALVASAILAGIGRAWALCLLSVGVAMFVLSGLI